MSERAIREYENSRVLLYSGPRRYSGRVVCRSKGSASRFISVERPFAVIHADAFSLFLPLCLYRFTIHRYLQLPTAIPFVLIFLVFLRFIFSLFLSFFFFFFSPPAPRVGRRAPPFTARPSRCPTFLLPPSHPLSLAHSISEYEI